MTHAKIYYDGNCPICAKEIAFYKKNIRDKSFNWININNCLQSDYVANLDFQKTKERFHIITLENEILIGVDAFIYLWKHTPKLRYFALIGKFPGIYHILLFFYEIFLFFRR